MACPYFETKVTMKIRPTYDYFQIINSLSDSLLNDLSIFDTGSFFPPQFVKLTERKTEVTKL